MDHQYEGGNSMSIKDSLICTSTNLTGVNPEGDMSSPSEGCLPPKKKFINKIALSIVKIYMYVYLE